MSRPAKENRIDCPLCGWWIDKTCMASDRADAEYAEHKRAAHPPTLTLVGVDPARPGSDRSVLRVTIYGNTRAELRERLAAYLAELGDEPTQGPGKTGAA